MLIDTRTNQRRQRQEKLALVYECRRLRARMNEWERGVIQGMDSGVLTSLRLEQLTQIHARVTGPAYTGSAA